METIDFYAGLKQIRNSTEPFAVTFTKLSLTLNDGGERRTLTNQLPGPLRKNMNDKHMIGLKDADTDIVSHIYIHTILFLNNKKMILK